MCDEIPCNIKQRFKGVENFLRRIAFNLGNSPSQTEVKIISCIPIDVTDLQQKIYDLERIIARYQKPSAIVHTALVETGTTGVNATPIIEDIIQEDTSRVIEQRTLSYHNSPMPELTAVDQNAEQNLIRPSTCTSYTTVFSDESKNANRNFFRKSKKKLPKNKPNRQKSHFVYYAQTDNSPFKSHFYEKKTEPKLKMKRESNDPHNLFLDDVISKQYKPLIYRESDFSSPVCRDIENLPAATRTAGSDICSCCHMDFLNIDKNKDSQNFNYSPKFHEQMNSQNMYYDSSLYDLEPVKENPVKTKKTMDKPKTKKQHKDEFDFSNYMDYSYADRSFTHPMYVNYHTLIQPQPWMGQNLPKKISTRKRCNRKTANRRIDVCNVADEGIQEDTSNSCRVECSNVYKKPPIIHKKPEPPKKIEMKVNTVTFNDAETATLNNTECQTTTTTQNAEVDSIPPSEGKTEETLNQIKTILQSVLTEVKTSNLKPSLQEEKSKKDAVVQKGTSLGNMPGSSRLLNSFSYGTYNAGPHGAACSYPINSGHHWPAMPYSPKCLHNFPVFIQTPGRVPYASCYRNTSQMSKPSTHKSARKAASAGTNTEGRNSETEKLIKEIYKSIALNIDIPKKETSVSNCSSSWKRSTRSSTKTNYRTDKSVSTRQGIMPQPVYRRDYSTPITQYSSNTLTNSRKDAMNSVPLTPFSSNTFSTKMTSNTVSVQSHAMTTDDRRIRSNRIGRYLDTTEEMPSEESATMRSVQIEHRPATANTEVSAELSSDDCSDGTENSQYQMTDAKSEKRQRTNLFSKMFKSVKLFKNRKRKSQKSKLSSEEEPSDSDDYQTIYSQQVEQARRLPKQMQQPARKVPHSKVSYSRQLRGRNQEKLRRATMEQEYRRQWNEQLMYQQRPRYSTDQSEHSYRGTQRFQNSYVARPVMVEQSIPVQNTMFQDILTTMPQQRMSRQPEMRVRASPPRGLSWFKKRMRCGENIVRSLIVDN
ncbi:uncharacterized protein LOC106130115 [Amyelois transitella]|uniref:uncharacterized protein LOC106130115 n=1 Tax=Amyelois transitella TaxID=680683 RepID=UPI00298F6F2A|nr:uncharacterized protein LOC106130115 [Amyelois transitella]